MSEASPESVRQDLLERIGELAGMAIFGTPSETYRTCGNKRCRCHGPGPKHGPHMYISFRGGAGKTAGYYVPKAAQEAVRDGVAAWRELQQCLRELAELNKDDVLARARAKRGRAR